MMSMLVVLFLGLFFVVFFAILGVVVWRFAKAGRGAARNHAALEVSAVASVLDKRTELDSRRNLMDDDSSLASRQLLSQRYFVTFQQPGGERFELEVPGSEFGLIAVGDTGTVTMKGTAYLGFAREVMR